MAPEALEAENVSLVAHTSLEDRPAFKIALDNIDGRWYLYLAHFWHPGWSIVDVTDPATPELVNFIEGPPNTVTKQIQVADSRMITSLERPTAGYGPVDDVMDPDEPYQEGAYVFDLSADPLNPELVGHYETGGNGTHRNFYDGGDYCYMVAWPEDYEKGMLTVVDVSEPSDPEEVGRWWWPGQHEDDDVDPDEAFYFHGPAYVVGDRAYLAYGRVGPVILDVSDPTQPELVSRLGMGDGLGSWLGTHSFVPLPDSDLAAITTEAILETSPLDDGDSLNYIALVDVSDERPPEFGTPENDMQPIGPKFLSTMPLPRPRSGLPYQNYYEKGGRFGPHNVHHSRDDPLRFQSSELLFSTWFNAGLRIYDIADPLVPKEVGHYVPEDPEKRIGTRPTTALVSHFEDVVVDERGYIYCTDTNNGLFILETSLL